MYSMSYLLLNKHQVASLTCAGLQRDPKAALTALHSLGCNTSFCHNKLRCVLQTSFTADVIDLQVSHLYQLLFFVARRVHVSREAYADMHPSALKLQQWQG